jgi:hypothetical protein
MSVRDLPVLWLNATKNAAGAVAAAGGNVLLRTPAHHLDGPEHLVASDSVTLDSTVDEHGLLPKLSGDATDALRGDGTWSPVVSTLALDDLTDVAITSPAAAQRLRYNGSLWVNVVTWYEPQFDAVGSAVLDGAGNPIMVEVHS